MTCSKCNKEANALINGRCANCHPFRICKACGTGTLVSKPTPNWMNRWVCDECGKKVSR